MSVLWRMPRVLKPVLVLVLCMVSTFALFAQSEEALPVSTSESVVVSSEVPVSIKATVNENVSDNKSVADTEKSDSVMASSQVAEHENKAISVAVSPAEEVVSTVSAEKVVLPETIPASNEGSPKADEAVVSSFSTTVAEAKPVEAVQNVEKAVVCETEETKTGVESGAKEVAKDAKDSKKLYYFESSRSSTLAVILILLAFVAYYTFQAQRGREMFIRRISGLSAIEDAVGRATEMGRSVLYVPGIADMDDIQTIAGVTIMGHVARKTAEYDTDFYAPQSRSFVMSVAHEVVKQAYMEKGRVDAYRPDRINYLTDDQFGYVAGVGGIMMRDKPAACFYLGTFYAESLILAETGNAVGAIQIAGTAEPSQIPFFVAACDYTLIGEELFAASAYLSKNPREVGSLKGQDMVKIAIIIVIIVGTLLETVAATELGQNSNIASVATTFMEYLK